MNIWSGGAPSDQGWKVYQTLNDYNDPGPSQTFVRLDEREDSINDGCFAVDMAGWRDQWTRHKIVDYPASYQGREPFLLPMDILRFTSLSILERSQD